MSLSEIAEHFGVSQSDVADRIAAITYNGDWSANTCQIIASVGSDGFSVRGETSGTYRVNWWLVMP